MLVNFISGCTSTADYRTWISGAARAALAIQTILFNNMLLYSNAEENSLDPFNVSARTREEALISKYGVKVSTGGFDPLSLRSSRSTSSIRVSMQEAKAHRL